MFGAVGVFLYVETLTSTCKHVHQLRMHDKAIFDYKNSGRYIFTFNRHVHYLKYVFALWPLNFLNSE